MGISILEQVLRILKQEGFTANVAFPGQKFPQITGAVATVHIEKVDRASLTVTLEVNIICPAAMGGTACELEALRATEVLRWDGATCVQNGCTYDGVSQVYSVSILATYTCITDADSCTMGPGFSVYIDDIRQYFVVSFSEEEQHGYEAGYAMGQSAPIGIWEGPKLWHITLEELIPAGSPETAEPDAPFELRISTKMKKEEYYHCRWTSIKREFTRDGLRRIRKGIAMDRKEV